MERTKLYKLIIATLVVINIGILVFFLVGKPGRPGPPKTGDLAKRLDITGENKAKVTALEKKHHEEKRLLLKNDRELHKDLFSKIGSEEDVSGLQEKIAANYAETEKMTFTFFDEVSNYCSEKQKKELLKTIRHAFHQMKGPKRR